MINNQSWSQLTNPAIVAIPQSPFFITAEENSLLLLPFPSLYRKVKFGKYTDTLFIKSWEDVDILMSVNCYVRAKRKLTCLSLKRRPIW